MSNKEKVLKALYKFIRSDSTAGISIHTSLKDCQKKERALSRLKKLIESL